MAAIFPFLTEIFLMSYFTHILYMFPLQCHPDIFVIFEFKNMLCGFEQCLAAQQEFVMNDPLASRCKEMDMVSKPSTLDLFICFNYLNIFT